MSEKYVSRELSDDGRARPTKVTPYASPLIGLFKVGSSVIGWLCAVRFKLEFISIYDAY